MVFAFGLPVSVSAVGDSLFRCLRGQATTQSRVGAGGRRPVQTHVLLWSAATKIKIKVPPKAHEQ